MKSKLLCCVLFDYFKSKLFWRNNIKLTRGVYLNNKLSWRTHIDKICKKVSKVYEMIYKLRYYVPLSTLKIAYLSLFHSHIQYS